MPHIHLHFDDVGTPEGARKAAQTRKQHGHIDSSNRDIRTSLPTIPGIELRKITNKANNQADKRGELTKPMTEYPVEKIPIANVVATQAGLNSALVNHYVKNPPKEHPAGILHKGQFYISDGHHRIEAAKRRGDTAINAHVQRVK